MHPHLGRRVVGVQRVGQAAEQVVVAEDAAPPLADVQLGQNIFREADAHRGARVEVRVFRPQLGRRLVDHLAGQPQRVLVGQRGVVALAAEVPQVQIVDDLVGQLVEALHQRHPGVGVAGDAQRTQDQLAELVRGGDGGGVERGQRVTQVVGGGPAVPRWFP